MKRVAWHLALIVAVAAFALFPHLGSTRLWDRDEPRNAGCAREMLERGDWVVPTFNHELRVLKPVLAYWCTMTAYQLFGVNEWSARLWSALFALGSSILTYYLGHRLFNEKVGLWAALILSTSLLWDTTGHLVTVDAHLMFFSTLALCFYVYGVFPAGTGNNEPTRDFPTGAMFVWLYIAVGLAILTKGLVGLVPPLAVIGMFLLIWRLPAQAAPSTWKDYGLSLLRPFAPLHVLKTCWTMRLVSGAVIALALAAPWYVLVGMQTDGEFLRGFFLEHHFGRAVTSMEGHGGPFLLYYLGPIVVGFFPWSVFLPAALACAAVALKRRANWSAGYLLCLCWVGVYLFIFSVPRTKLPSYIAPCYPALALLAGCFLERWIAGLEASSLWPRRSLRLLGAAGVVLLVAAVVAAMLFMPGKEWLGVVGLIPLAGAAVAWWLMKKDLLPQAASALVIMALAFNTAFFGLGLVALSGEQRQEVLFSAMKENCPEPKVGWFGCLEPTWVFYLGRPIYPLVVVRDGMEQPESTPWNHTPQDAADWFCAGPDRFIITNNKDWPWLKAALPADATVLAECDWFLRRKTLLVVGHGKTAVAGSNKAQPGL
ncbi:MAG: ArnT family glycosyltransferase [Gemmataceae bacterium]